MAVSLLFYNNRPNLGIQLILVTCVAIQYWKKLVKPIKANNVYKQFWIQPVQKRGLH